MVDGVRTIPEDLKKTLRDYYPTLSAVRENGTLLIRGQFPIVSEGEVLDRFQIEIEVPRDFPDAVPILRETGERVPPVPDRHVNSNGEACPLVPEEWMILPKEQRTIIHFLQGPVRNFFLFQSFADRGLEWLAGQRDHGRPGLLQAYGEMLGVSDSAAIPKYLDYLGRKEIKGHWDCPCGGGKRLRDCHRDQIRGLQHRIPRWVAKSAFDRLRNLP
jgi:hypothetical protein